MTRATAAGVLPCAVCGAPVEAAGWMLSRPSPPAIHCTAHLGVANEVLAEGRLRAAAARTEEVAQDRLREWRRGFARRVVEFNPSAGYGDARLGEPGVFAATTRLLQSAFHASRGPAGRSAAVVLAGAAGTGKTRAGFAVLNAAADKSVRPARIVFGDETATFGEKPWERPGNARAVCVGARAVMIDDVGTAELGDTAARHSLWQALLTSAEHSAGPLLLVLTTNLQGWEALEAWIGPYAQSRLVGLGGYARGGDIMASAGVVDMRDPAAVH